MPARSGNLHEFYRGRMLFTRQLIEKLINGENFPIANSRAMRVAQPQKMTSARRIEHAGAAADPVRHSAGPDCTQAHSANATG